MIGISSDVIVSPGVGRGKSQRPPGPRDCRRPREGETDVTKSFYPSELGVIDELSHVLPLLGRNLIEVVPGRIGIQRLLRCIRWQGAGKCKIVSLGFENEQIRHTKWGSEIQ